MIVQYNHMKSMAYCYYDSHIFFWFNKKKNHNPETEPLWGWGFQAPSVDPGIHVKGGALYWQGDGGPIRVVNWSAYILKILITAEECKKKVFPPLWQPFPLNENTFFLIFLSLFYWGGGGRCTPAWICTCQKLPKIND